MFCNALEATSWNYDVALGITSLSERGSQQLDNEIKMQQIDISLQWWGSVNFSDASERMWRWPLSSGQLAQAVEKTFISGHIFFSIAPVHQRFSLNLLTWLFSMGRTRGCAQERSALQTVQNRNQSSHAQKEPSAPFSVNSALVSTHSGTLAQANPVLFLISDENAEAHQG